MAKESQRNQSKKKLLAYLSQNSNVMFIKCKQKASLCNGAVAMETHYLSRPVNCVTQPLRLYKINQNTVPKI